MHFSSLIYLNKPQAEFPWSRCCTVSYFCRCVLPAILMTLLHRPFSAFPDFLNASFANFRLSWSSSTHLTSFIKRTGCGLIPWEIFNPLTKWPHHRQKFHRRKFIFCSCPRWDPKFSFNRFNNSSLRCVFPLNLPHFPDHEFSFGLDFGRILLHLKSITHTVDDELAFRSWLRRTVLF